MWRIMFFVLALFFINFQQYCFSQNKKIIAEKYYQEGIKLYQAGKNDSAVKNFKKALKYNRKLADAHNQLALIYMDQGTIHSRFRSGLELDKALRLDWDNPEYHFNKALLYLKKGMDGTAFHEFKKVIKLDPDNFMAYYHLGLIKEEDVMHYRDMIDPEQAGIIFFRKFAENDKQKAVYYFNKTIALNPQFTEVYYRLGLLYYEFYELDQMIELLEKAVKINPDDKNCHLFLGFAYAQSENYKLALQEYETAMKLMPFYERQLFESIDLIMTPEQKATYHSYSSSKQKKKRDMFWKDKDPFLMTEINERKLEHYSRIAYVNLRYSDPKKNIEGWQTDRGKVYIRYGKPKTMFRTRPEMNSSPNFAQSSGYVAFSKELWSYPDFDFIFEDRFLSRRYEFARGNSPYNDYRSIYEQMIEKTPEYYQYIPEDKLLEITSSFPFFKDRNNRTLVEANFAVPADSIYLLLRDKKWQTNVKQGIFLLNEEKKKNYSSINEYNWTENMITKVGKEKFFIDRNRLAVPPGNYNLVLEVHDLESGKRSSLRKPMEVTSYNEQRLQLSDILLAFNIESESTATDLTRNFLKILPNPLKRFPSNTPISIYYEIYNLSQNRDGFTSFRIENTISSNKEKIGNFKKLLSKLRFIKIDGDVTTSYQYEGNSPTEIQFQKIDLGKRHKGNLTLMVKVTDLYKNKTVMKKVEFKLYNPQNFQNIRKE